MIPRAAQHWRRSKPLGRRSRAIRKTPLVGPRDSRVVSAVAARSGWEIVGLYEDAGFSGAKGRDKRPGFDRLLKDATARKINMIAAWSVDRLGPSLQDLVSFLTELQALGCDLYLHQQALDTSTPSGRAMFQMCAVFAEFERGMIRERVNAGLARARAKGTKLGRRPVKLSVEKHIRELRSEGMGILKIGRTVGVGTSVVQRIVQEPAKTYAPLKLVRLEKAFTQWLPSLSTLAAFPLWLRESTK